MAQLANRSFLRGADPENSHSQIENESSAPFVAETKSLPQPRFQSVLSEISLFRNSRWERIVARTVPLLTTLFRQRCKPVPSSVVPHMTLWEQFLTHRCRYARRMTLAVGLRNQFVAEESFAASAIVELVRIVARHNSQWENQPLNVVVTEACRTRMQDPRNSTGQIFPIAFADEAGTFRTCHLNLTIAAPLHDGELTDYVLDCMSEAQPSTNPVCAVIDRAAADPEIVCGSYIEFPGAWLRVAVDQSTGGIVVTADHLVLDGALFQHVLIKLAQATITSFDQTMMPSKLLCGNRAFSSRKPDPFVTIQLEHIASLSEVLLQIISVLESSGLQLQDGRDTVLLTTIPQGGPEANSEIQKHKRRILPVILSVDGVNDHLELRSRIRKLNTDGWCSAGAVIWNYIYRRNLPYWLIKYFECFSHKVPFQQSARVLCGGALVSCLPPVAQQDFCAYDVSHLSSRTIGTTIGGPTITVMQMRNCGNDRITAFITISGTGRWNNAAKLNDLRTLLAARFSQLEPQKTDLPQQTSSLLN